MPISRTKRQLSTTTAGLRQSKPYTRLPINEISHNAPELGFFPLQSTQYPPGTPATAVRSKKMYSDLVDERAFLLKIKEYWVDKLKDLEEDHKYLSKMKDVQKNQVIGVQPLFAKEEDEPLELQHPPLPSATATEESQDNDISDINSTTDLQPSSPGQFSLLGDNIELSNLNQLDQLEVLFKNKFSDEEDNGDEEENEEDEAKTREALSLLLQEFGDM